MGDGEQALFIQTQEATVPHERRLPGQQLQGRGISAADAVADTMAERMIGMGEGVVGRMAGGTGDAAVSR